MTALANDMTSGSALYPRAVLVLTSNVHPYQKAKKSGRKV